MIKWTKTIALGIAILMLMSCAEPTTTTESADTEEVRAAPAVAVDVRDVASPAIGSPEFVIPPQPSPTPPPTPTPRPDGVAGPQPPLRLPVSIKYAMMLRCGDIDRYACSELDPSQLNPEFAQNENICIAWREEGNPPGSSNLRIRILQGEKQILSRETRLHGNKTCQKAPIRVPGAGDYRTELAWSDRREIVTWSISTPIPTDSPTPTAIPTATSTPSSTPTSVPQEAAATATNILFEDDFSSNVNDWREGELSNDSLDRVWAVTNGQLQLSMTSKREGGTWSSDGIPDFSARNFVLNFDAKIVEQSGDFSSGHPAVRVTFRASNGGFYRIFFDNDAYRVDVVEGNDARRLVDWTKDSAIRLEENVENSFAISVKDSTFVLSANGQSVLEFSDETIEGSGAIGLGASLFEANQSVIVAFDDLTVTKAP